MRRVLALALLLLIEAAPRPGHACTLAGNGTHRLDPQQASDTVAPSAPTVVEVDVARYEDDELDCGISSCGSYGLAQVTLEATDDASHPDLIGYQLRLVSGTLPRGLTLPTEPIAGGGALYLYFDEDAPDFEAEIEARAVDLNGNLGPPTTFVIADASAGGCASRTGRTGPLGSLAVLGLALALVVRRKRR
jgi:MYXO-CTERM domain-containing protein